MSHVATSRPSSGSVTPVRIFGSVATVGIKTSSLSIHFHCMLPFAHILLWFFGIPWEFLEIFYFLGYFHLFIFIFLLIFLIRIFLIFFFLVFSVSDFFILIIFIWDTIILFCVSTLWRHLDRIIIILWIFFFILLLFIFYSFWWIDFSSSSMDFSNPYFDLLDLSYNCWFLVLISDHLVQVQCRFFCLYVVWNSEYIVILGVISLVVIHSCDTCGVVKFNSFLAL